MVIRKTRDSVLAPAISTATRLVVAEVIPRGAARAIVFAHCPPLTLADVRAPATPILLAVATFLDASPFGINRLRHLCLSPAWLSHQLLRMSARPARAAA